LKDVAQAMKQKPKKILSNHRNSFHCSCTLRMSVSQNLSGSETRLSCEQDQLTDISCDTCLKHVLMRIKFFSFGCLWKTTIQGYQKKQYGKVFTSFCDNIRMRSWILCCCCHGNKMSISFDNRKGTTSCLFFNDIAIWKAVHRKVRTSITLMRYVQLAVHKALQGSYYWLMLLKCPEY
jgi:hypothetical protein